MRTAGPTTRDPEPTPTGSPRLRTPPPGCAVGRLAGLRAGTEFGTFVHAVLERTDFRAADLDGAIDAAVEEELRRSGASPDLLAPPGTDGRALLVAGLRDTVETPLGPLFDTGRLADLDIRDRLDELSFDMRVGGAGRHPEVSELGAVVLRHLPQGHPLHPWAGSLAAGALDVRLAGYLTGSIDLVARLAPDRFVVADYKSNQLTRWGAEPDPSDYDTAHLAGAMAEHHYPLQALLYGVALHRYLRSRRRGRHPAGRGRRCGLPVRAGHDRPDVAVDGGHPRGVFTWAVRTGAAGRGQCGPRRVDDGGRVTTTSAGGAAGWSTDAACGPARAVDRGRGPGGRRGPAGDRRRAGGSRSDPPTTCCSGSPWRSGRPVWATCAWTSDCPRPVVAALDDEGRAAAPTLPDPDRWRDATGGSPIVTVVPGPGPEGGRRRPVRPLVLEGHRLYLQRFWRFEVVGGRRDRPAGRRGPPSPGRLAAGRRGRRRAVAAEVFGGVPLDEDGTVDLQFVAARRALTRPVSVITGGPGDGQDPHRRPHPGRGRPGGRRTGATCSGWRWPHPPARRPPG